MRHRSTFPGLLFVICLLWTSALSVAQPAPTEPFPMPPTGGHLAIEPALDDATWDTARRCLPGASSVGAQYYALVVDDLEAAGRPAAEPYDAVPFVDAAYRSWRSADPSILDSDRHILVALALGDRAVAVHPGYRWAEMGLEGRTIQAVIDGSEFGDHARDGNLAQAVCALAGAVDSWLARQLRQEAVEREEALAEAARQAAVREFAPFVLLAFLALLVLVAVAAQYLRVRRMKVDTARAIEDWRSRLAIAAERLLELERLHPIYFTADMRRWTGRSRDLDRQCADAVNRVYLLYSRAMELLGRARDELQVTGSLRLGPVLHAWSFLHDAEVVIEEGVPAEGDDRRRIFVPLMQEVRTVARELLTELDAAYGEALDRLQHVADLETRRDELVQQVDELAEQALAACHRRRDFGLPVSHLDAPLEDALGERDRARGELASDPLVAVEVLEPCLVELQAVIDRAVLGNDVIARLRTEITPRARALRQRIDALRADGFRLDEPGFQPDLRLDRGAEDAESVEAAVAEGREAEAAVDADDLARALDDLSAQIEASAAARDEVPEVHGALTQELVAVQARTPASRQILEALARSHAPRSWQEESDNLDEVDALLRRLEESLDEILRDHAEQNYLAALEDLATCRLLLDDCSALHDEIEIIEKVLDGCRERSGALLETVEGLASGLRETASAPGVGGDLRKEIENVLDETADVSEACASDLPDWTDLEPRLAAGRRRLEDLRLEADAEIRAHREAAQLRNTLRTHWKTLLDTVQSESRDRPHVESSVRQVGGEIDRWEERLHGGGAGAELAGRELLRRGRELLARLEWAQGLWRSEMELVRVATAELRAAETSAERRQGRRFSHGVRVDLDSARRPLRQAQAAERAQEWERVLDEARAAHDAISRAVAEAEAESSRLERKERQRLAAMAAMEVLRIGVTAAAAAAGARGGRRSRMSSWPSRSSASSSLGSLRPRGGSRGSSWGGSRSGGSRW